MARGDVVSGSLLTAIGLYAAAQAYEFGLGTLSQPGAGFFPFWAAVLIVGCTSMVVIRGLARRAQETVAADDPGTTGGGGKIALCVLGLVVYAIALPLVGFLPSTFIVMTGLARLAPETTWNGALAIAAAGAAGFWVIFVHFLGVAFPTPLLAF